MKVKSAEFKQEFLLEASVYDFLCFLGVRDHLDSRKVFGVRKREKLVAAGLKAQRILKA